MFSAAWYVARHLGAVLLLGWIATVLGARLLAAMRFASPAEALALRASTGLVALGTIGFGLGLAGRLDVATAALLFAAVAVVCRRESVELWRDARAWARTLVRAERARLLIAATFLLVAAPTVALALYPPTGYDALNYHLPYVRAFIEHGRLVPVESLVFPVFPQLEELLFTLVALLVDDVAAQAVQLLPTFLIALLLASWAGRVGGRSSAALAGALWLGHPLVVWMAGQAYVDIGLTLFVVAGYACLERWRLDRERGFLALGGAFLGAACAIKYLGIFALGLAICHAFGTAKGGRRVRDAVVLVAAAAAIAAPWYLRIAWETGNPVFPYLHEVFGGVNWLRIGSGGEGTPTSRRFLEMALAAPAWLLTLPFTVTWAREMFGRQAPLAPWTAVVVLLTAWRAWFDRRLAWVLAGCAAYSVLALLSLRSDLRFLLPVAAVLAAGGAVAARPAFAAALEVARSARGRWASLRWLARGGTLPAVAVLAAIAPGAFYGAYKLWERGPLPVEPAGREQFLARWVPAYRAVSYLDRSLPAGDFTLYGLAFEPVRYYVRGSYLGGKYGKYSYRLLGDPARDPDATHGLLRRWRADYLLLPARWGQRLESAARCFEPVYRDDEAWIFRVVARAAGDCAARSEKPVETNEAMQGEG